MEGKRKSKWPSLPGHNLEEMVYKQEEADTEAEVTCTPVLGQSPERRMPYRMAYTILGLP